MTWNDIHCRHVTKLLEHLSIFDISTLVSKYDETTPSRYLLSPSLLKKRGKSWVTNPTHQFALLLFKIKDEHQLVNQFIKMFKNTQDTAVASDVVLLCLSPKIHKWEFYQNKHTCIHNSTLKNKVRSELPPLSHMNLLSFNFSWI